MAQLTKQELRERILDLIKNQREEDAFSRSRDILGKLLALPVFQAARTIMFYVSFKGEVDTFPMMEKAFELKKRVVVPVAQKETRQLTPVVIGTVKELNPGAYGIPEPRVDASRVILPQDLDLVIVPGVAFDRAGNRLGRGAGYYDRFLSALPSTTATVGLGYDFQVVPSLPGLEPHDRRVMHILTN